MKHCPICGKEYSAGETCDQDGAVLILKQATAMDLIGQVLKGSYRVVEQIGEGGMATVFRGVQMPLEREVAIKVMLPSLQSTPSMIQRFFQEAKLLCRLSHPNVVSIIDFGNTETGTVYMVMELLRGRPLRAEVPSSGLPLSRVVTLMQEICAGVGAVHSCGLAHRDLKPDNIFIAESSDGSEQVKILDFGIARAMDDEAGTTRLTRTGLVMGTPGFLAPEQIGDAGEADTRSDVYALGAVLYWMLTGQRPYSGKTPNAILTKQLQEPPPLDIGCLKHNRALAQVVEKAMHRDPQSRYQTPADLAGALTAVAASADGAAADESVIETMILGTGVASSETKTRPLTRRDPRKPLWTPMRAGAVLGVALLGVLAWLWLRTEPSVPNDAATTGAPVGRGVSDDRVLIGMSAAFSGSSKELGRGMRLGIDTCFQEINDAGGIHGRHLELVALDDGYEPSRTVANMAELLLERRVFALLGNVGTPTAEVALPLAREQKVPFVGAFTGADLLRGNPPEPLVFNFRAGYAQETAALVEYFLDVRGLAPSELAVFAQEDSFGDAGYRGVVDTLERRGHNDKVPRIGYRRNRTDVEDAVDRLLRLEPRVRAVVLVATYRAAAELIAGLRTERPDLLFAGLSFIGSRALAEELGPDNAEGVIVSQVVPHYASTLPGVAAYRDALSTYFPSEQPGFVSLEGYLACRTFAAGLHKAGVALDAGSFAAAMDSVSELDLGIGRPVGFGAGRRQASDHVWGTVLDGSADYQSLELRPTAP